ncbi:MAG: hypothetical protein V9E85_00320 [Candidatus Nanopelagicales bacterium]
MQAIKVAGIKYGVLSMDYNFLANQNGGKTSASKEKCQQIEDDTYNAYTNALKAVNGGNRAPLILGNHMNDWVCGAYTKALSRFIEDSHEREPNVRFISTSGPGQLDGCPGPDSAGGAAKAQRPEAVAEHGN